MLVLTRKPLETLFIGENICVTVVRLGDGQVRLGIDAPREISIVRGELRERDRVRRAQTRPIVSPADATCLPACATLESVC